MGAFFLMTKNIKNDWLQIEERAHSHFAAAGFAAPVLIDAPTFRLSYYDKISSSESQFVQITDSNFIACIGTFIYKGSGRSTALRKFFFTSDYEKEILECIGHFTLIVFRDGELRIFCDRCAAMEIFHDHDLKIFTSSFLAIVRALPPGQIDRQSVYEYVFNGVTLGTATLFSSVRRLDTREIVVITDAPRILTREFPLLPPEAAVNGDGACALLLRDLQDMLTTVAGAYNGNLTLALSAGYDTRLLLATCRSIGVAPKLFVYGPENSKDVSIAKMITSKEGIPLHHVNKAKAAAALTEEAFPDVVAANFLDYEGIGHYGIITSRAEYKARLSRHEGGAINIHGGGGEILRNLLGMADSHVSIMEIIRAFYCAFDQSICAEGFSRERYQERILEKITAFFKTNSTLLSRREADAFLPYFRWRAWYGRDNCMNVRYGHSLLAFYEDSFIDKALSVPPRLKWHGDLEARMIRAADPRLAEYPSAYGRSFAKDAPFGTTIADRLKYLRPGLLRMYTSVWKQRRRVPLQRSGLLADKFMSRIIDLRFPIMSTFFRVDRIRDPEEYARICSLEYLFSRVSVDGTAVAA